MALEAISQAGDRLEELERHVVLDELVKVADGIWRVAGRAEGTGRAQALEQRGNAEGAFAQTAL